MLTHSPKNKMFALAFANDEGGYVTQDSVSYVAEYLESRVHREFETDKMQGEIPEDAELTKTVDSGNPNLWVYRYDDEEEGLLYAQIELVNIIDCVQI